MTPPLGGKSEASKTALSGSQPFKPPALPVVPDLVHVENPILACLAAPNDTKVNHRTLYLKFNVIEIVTCNFIF